MSELDDAVILRPAGELAFDVDVSGGWGISGIPNGGYLSYLGARALAAVLPHPDPLTVTTRYARPALVGPARVECELIKIGRTQSAGVAKVLQQGKERLRVTATYGALDALDGPTLETGAPPPMPPPEAIAPRIGAPPGSTFGDRVDLRFAPGTVPFLDGERGPMALGGWIRLADGREPDPHVLLLFADAFPPPALNGVDARVWVPTIELTVHVRRRPSPGFVRAWFSTRFLIGGRLEEDGELWDASGRLVALSRQYALFSTGG
ncbi:MAG: thioesterase family protein [Sandaracinaceae bacterium]|nr:thioesterase family protein [Sandaracinaceae bacterium]